MGGGSDALSRALVGLLFAADGPLSAATLASLLARAAAEEEWDGPTDEVDITRALERLAQADFGGQQGVQLVQVAHGWRIRTAPDLGLLVRRLWPERALRLSKAALETLAVVAYRQPCTRAEIEAVRGVNCGGIVRTLMDRDLLRIIGRKDEPGRPLLYGTTPTFLETFSLEDLRHLPTLRDLDALRAEEASLARGVRTTDEEPPADEAPTDEGPVDQGPVDQGPVDQGPVDA